MNSASMLSLYISEAVMLESKEPSRNLAAELTAILALAIEAAGNSLKDKTCEEAGKGSYTKQSTAMVSEL